MSVGTHPSLLVAALLAALPLASCQTGSRNVRGVPRSLPRIALYGSPKTPPHAMSKDDYPFDANGNYVTQWVSEAPSSTQDYRSWRSSYGSSSKPRVRVSSSRASGSSKSSGSYTIKRGDTLGAIAQRHGTTVSKLKAANGLKSSMIREGRQLVIPGR
jgi:hypothetical protein